MVFILIVTAVSGSTLFFVQLYKKDKMKDVLRSELANVQQASDHLNSLMNLVDLIDLDKARFSKKIILLNDSPCNKSKDSHTIVSESYEKQFQEMQIKPEVWLDSLTLFKTCTLLSKSPAT